VGAKKSTRNQPNRSSKQPQTAEIPPIVGRRGQSGGRNLSAIEAANSEGAELVLALSQRKFELLTDAAVAYHTSACETNNAVLRGTARVLDALWLIAWDTSAEARALINDLERKVLDYTTDPARRYWPCPPLAPGQLTSNLPNLPPRPNGNRRSATAKVIGTAEFVSTVYVSSSPGSPAQRLKPSDWGELTGPIPITHGSGALAAELMIGAVRRNFPHLFSSAAGDRKAIAELDGWIQKRIRNCELVDAERLAQEALTICGVKPKDAKNWVEQAKA
jgi:hypothetical protein